MGNQLMKCIDTGSQHCPCYLSETGNCLMCSRLQGKDVCDCNWTGVCIYNEYMLNGGKKAAPREERKCRIISRKEILPDYIVFEIQVDKGFAIKCLRPGSYIFIRNAETESFYNIPVSLLAVDYLMGSISVGVRIISVKTRALFDSKESVIVRGPYRNGIIGLDYKMINSRILIAAKGAGAAPGIFAYNLLCGNNKVDFLLNDDVLEKSLLSEYISETQIDKIKDHSVFNLADLREKESVCNQLKNDVYDNIIVLGSDEFIDKFKEAAEQYYNDTMESTDTDNLKTEVLKDVYLSQNVNTLIQRIAYSNNSVSCCGEGICGACSHVNKDGQRIPMCKCANQLLFE